jgi:hypothetical protein
MNRDENLLRCLASWVNVEQINEIVVVDWSSKNPIIENENICNVITEKVKIIRVENESFFSLPKSYNLAYKHTNSDNKIVMKLDADYESIDHYWLSDLNIKDCELNGYFLTGDHRTHKEHSGFILANKKDFILFNENFEGWGFHDQWIYEQMNKKSKHVLFSDIDKYIKHIPHSYAKRVKNYENKDMFDTMKKNRCIAASKPSFEESKYNFSLIQKNYIVAQRVKSDM